MLVVFNLLYLSLFIKLISYAVCVAVLHFDFVLCYASCL